MSIIRHNGATESIFSLFCGFPLFRGHRQPRAWRILKDALLRSLHLFAPVFERWLNKEALTRGQSRITQSLKQPL